MGPCGVSGAGKSSLAVHTLYAEGQRRYVESFSAHARQFLERKARPDVDRLEPVPVGIAVARQGAIRTRRSTVATLTDLADFAKTLWTRLATLHCHQCGAAMRLLAPEEVAKEVRARVEGERIAVSYPLRFAAAEEFAALRDDLVREGYRRVVRAGSFADLDELDVAFCTRARQPQAEWRMGRGCIRRGRRATGMGLTAERRGLTAERRTRRPSRLTWWRERTVARSGELGRLTDAIETSMRRGGGRADVWRGNERLRFSSGLHCAPCDIACPRAQEGLFSFNSPMGHEVQPG